MATETKKRALWQIGADEQALLDLLDERGGDITDPADEQIIMAYLEEVGSALESKADGYADMIGKLETEAAVAREHKERYAKLEAAREKSAKYLKERMKQYMEGAGKKEVAMPLTLRRFAIEGNGGKQPMPIMVEEVANRLSNFEAAYKPATQSPEVMELSPFVKLSLSLDTEKVRTHLEGGGKLTFAALEPRGTHLAIRFAKQK